MHKHLIRILSPVAMENVWQMRTVGILEKDSVTYYHITFRR